jgi:hypothetical protein
LNLISNHPRFPLPSPRNPPIFLHDIPNPPSVFLFTISILWDDQHEQSVELKISPFPFHHLSSPLHPPSF